MAERLSVPGLIIMIMITAVLYSSFHCKMYLPKLVSKCRECVALAKLLQKRVVKKKKRLL